MIIAVDYDGTLYQKGKVNEPLLDRLRFEQRRGAVVILWTCREGQSLMKAVQNLAKHGFRPNFVNCNCPAAVRMMGHDSRKVYADIYIDDKSRF